MSKILQGGTGFLSGVSVLSKGNALDTSNDTYGHLIPEANREAVNQLGVMIENAPLVRLEEKRG